MSNNKTNHEFVEQYLQSSNATKNNKSGLVKLIVCVVLYILIIIVQAKLSGQNSISGIIAQGQVLLSVLMIVGTTSYAYRVAVITNLINSFIVLNAFIRTDNTSIIPGIIVPLITIVMLTVIHFFSKRLNQKVNEIIHKNDELGMIYEEMVATEEELAEQNKQLNEYNQLMKQNEEKLNYLAFFDSLTELPNRKMILDRLELLFRLATKKDLKFALIFIDLDNFKKINDSLGHDAGDILLKTAVDRLKNIVHPEDLLGRLGGDEFALIIQRPYKEAELLSYIEQLKEVLLEVFIIQNSSFNISASFGIALYPQDGDTAYEIMKSADTAMYKAKEYGRNGIQFFSVEMKDEVMKRIEFENSLRAALQNNDFHLVYQPQYTSNTKELRGLEVLTRWHSPTLGHVNPAHFIPVAEETGLINPLGEWVIRTACLKLKDIHTNNTADLVMSINISAVQIMEPNFIPLVKSIISETGCNPHYLEFEITESMFISSMDYVIVVLTELKKLGIRIALDDFGTGYSSLNYLQLLPIDTLKIDKSFIDSIDINHARKPIVGSIISLVHQMNISVVAEGVENETQLHYLRNQSCDFIQGFYWGKPVNDHDLNLLFSHVY